MKRSRGVRLVSCTYLAVLCVGQALAVEVTVERSNHGAVVRVDGQLFAEYRTRSGHQPAIWPIIGPTGQPLTRSYPVGPLLDTEKDDHPHHHSLWFAHEDVNGHDFWVEPKQSQGSDAANLIKHVRFERVESLGDQAVLVTRNQWETGAGNVQCEDQRTIVFGANDDSRWIDYTTTIFATNGPVTFGDIKDGTFSIRVAGTMKVDAGGRITNSAGRVDAKAWGMPADWVDYCGEVAGEEAGIAIFSHPSNFQHPCRWHVRNYGLFTANPFGDRQFPKAKIKQQGVTIKEGESLTLRYRVYLHRGDTQEANVAAAFDEFATQPTSEHPLPVVFEDGFENGMGHWWTTDAEQETTVWSVQPDGKGEQNHFLRVSGKSSYQPPHRSPHSISLIKEVEVKDFELIVKLQNTNPAGGNHRDLCLFWGYQDPSHFYYAHLGAKPDPHSSQIFIVNDAARTMITESKSLGIPWTDGWHQVKVIHRSKDGLMQVFFDDMRKPVMTTHDTTFTSGRVGLGTFDDSGNFDEVKLLGELVQVGQKP